MDYYVVNTLQDVFQSDALQQTHPMTNYIESPGAISAAFDNIAYAKCELINWFYTRCIYTYVSRISWLCGSFPMQKQIIEWNVCAF